MKLPLLLAIALWFIVLFSIIANFFGWYEAYGNLDWVMHFLGGAWVAGAILYFYERQRWASPSFFRVLFWFLIIALSWELHEFVADRFLKQPLFQQGSLDTAGDLFFGLLGASIFLAWRKLFLSKEVKD